MLKNGRQFVLDALEQAGVVGIRNHPKREAFLAGAGDISFKDLEMDSLARMELCIYIEVNAGIEIGPDQLDEAASLSGFLTLIERDQ
jgi:hypothetical protein